MKRHNDEHIGEALKKTLAIQKLSEGHIQYLLDTKWEEEMGKFIAANTEFVKIKGRKVTIRLHSSSLRHEFVQNKEALILRLNDIIQREDYIESVAIY